MLKKEFRELIVPALARLSIVSIPVPIYFIFFMGSDFTLFDLLKFCTGCLGIAICWIANNFGLQALKTEFRDNAFEYLCSFPMSAYRIISNKLVPRLLILSVLTGGYLALALIVKAIKPGTQMLLVFPLYPAYFPVWVLFFLVLGFSLSLIRKPNVRAGLNFVLFMNFVLFALHTVAVLRDLGVPWGANWETVLFAFLMIAIVLILIMAAAFLIIAGRFEPGLPDSYGKKFMYWVGLPLTVTSIAGLII
ncbi:MAG: hypothetical protein GY757_37725 [bacterium]|nr:hypothetical protein [bacterium]